MNNPLIEKIISGGQTGADMGGLLAGRELGIPTGGYAPRGWKTERRRQEEWLKSFNLEEWKPFGYAARTQANVILCDATIIFGNIHSPGSLLTSKYCKSNRKSLYIQFFSKYGSISIEKLLADSQKFRLYLAQQPIGVLNVAGNRESKNPGIEDFTRRFLINALRGEAS